MRPVYEAIMRARKNATITREIMPTRSWRRRRHARSQRPGESWPATDGGSLRIALMGGSFEGHARVDELVHHVDQQVDHHRDDGEVDGHRLDDGEVAAVHRGHDLPPEAGDREEHLEEERAHEDAGERDAHVGED